MNTYKIKHMVLLFCKTLKTSWYVWNDDIIAVYKIQFIILTYFVFHVINICTYSLISGDLLPMFYGDNNDAE